MIQPIADRQESMDDKIISRREKLRLWRETKQSTVRAPLGKKEIPSDTTKHDKENCVNQQSTQKSHGHFGVSSQKTQSDGDYPAHTNGADDFCSTHFSQIQRDLKALKRNNLPSDLLQHVISIQQAADILQEEDLQHHERNGALIARVKHLNRNYRAIQASYEQREDVVKKVLNESSELTQKLEKATASSEAYKRRCQDLEQRADHLQREKNQLKQDLELKDSTIEQFARDYIPLERYQILQMQFDEQKIEKEEADGFVVDLENELKKYLVLHDTLSEKDSLILELQEQIQKLRSDQFKSDCNVVQMKQALFEKDEELTTLKQVLNECVTENEMYQQNLDAIKLQQVAQTDIQSTQTDAPSPSLTHQQTETDPDPREHEVMIIIREFANLKMANGLMADQIDAIQKQHMREVTQLKMDSAKSKSWQSDLEATIKAIEDKAVEALGHLTEKQKFTEQELQKERQHSEQLREQIGILENHLQRLLSDSD